MSFASPLLWWPVAAAVAGTALLHLLSWRRPRPRLLPTARFIPPATQPSRFRRVEPSDLALLLLRLVALVALGAAAAGPLVRWRRDGTARVVVVDRSRAVAEVARSVAIAESLAVGAAEVRVVAFDSTPSVLTMTALAADTARRAAVGQLSAALVTASHAASELHARYDSVEVALVSPLVAEEVDASLPLIAGEMGSAIQLHRVTAAVAEPPRHPASPSLPDVSDPVGAAAWVAWGGAPAHLRLSRAGLTAADSAFARDGGTVVRWATGEAPTTAAAGLVAGDRSVAGPFAPSSDSLRGTVLARWHDGRIAATEEILGAGCVRSVGVLVPSRGDVALRPAFTSFLRELTAPCTRARFELADPAILRAPTGVPTVAPVTAPDARLQRLLAALALVALGAEMWVRRARRVATAQLSSAARRAKEAA